MQAGKFSAVLRIGYAINQRCAAEVLEPRSWLLYHLSGAEELTE
jgi:hypothetical protein